MLGQGGAFHPPMAENGEHARKPPPPGEALWPEPAPEGTGSDSVLLKALGGAAGPERGRQ